MPLYEQENSMQIHMHKDVGRDQAQPKTVDGQQKLSDAEGRWAPGSVRQSLRLHSAAVTKYSGQGNS